MIVGVAFPCGQRFGLGLWLHASSDPVILEGCDAGVSFGSSHDPRTQVTLTDLVATPPREQLPPLEAAGVLERISGETEIATDVRVIPAPGHTPAHIAVEVGASGGIVYAVDAFLHPLQAERPGWGRGMDLDADAAVATRHALLGRAGERGHLLTASHWDAVLQSSNGARQGLAG